MIIGKSVSPSFMQNKVTFYNIHHLWCHLITCNFSAKCNKRLNSTAPSMLDLLIRIKKGETVFPVGHWPSHDYPLNFIYGPLKTVTHSRPRDLRDWAHDFGGPCCNGIGNDCDSSFFSRTGITLSRKSSARVARDYAIVLPHPPILSETFDVNSRHKVLLYWTKSIHTQTHTHTCTACGQICCLKWRT